MLSRNELIEKHLPLVPPIARSILKRLPPSFEFGDLLAEGNLALVKAAAEYQPEDHGGAPFSAYARFRIRSAMLESTRRKNYRAATCAALEEAPEPTFDPAIEEAIDTGRRIHQVRNLVEKLTEAQKAVIGLYYVPEEPTFEAVAIRIDRSIRVTKQRHADALNELRRELKAA